MKDLYIYHERFGKCRVIAFFKDMAILRLQNNYDKYVVTIGLSRKYNNWRRGFYYKSLNDAISAFSCLLSDLYEVIV